jgi:hypothetical protein
MFLSQHSHNLTLLYEGKSDGNVKYLLIYEILNIYRTAEHRGRFGVLIHDSYPDGCIPGLHVTYTEQRITHSLINHCIRFACNSAGTEELPDDNTHVSKQVGAAE